MWSTFADHGTVTRFQFTYYNRDHHGAATQLVEDAIRRAGDVPPDQEVVNAYGNTDEGDQTAGLHRAGPAAADHVGRVEARAFMRAWREAGEHMTATPVLDRRWTRMCWCGQQTAAGPVADEGMFGLPQFTGSEEGRGPLFDVTGVPFEGHHLPVGVGPPRRQDRRPAPGRHPRRGAADGAADRRADDRLDPRRDDRRDGAPGARARSPTPPAAPASPSAVISGLANEYIDYFTTPQEYDAQHYEGGATIYGRASGVALQEVLVELTRSLVQGRPAPPPYPYDPRNGVDDNAAPFSLGAASATAAGQHTGAWRLGRPSFSWQGGLRGFDRPLDRAFVQIQRPAANGGWRTVDSDLGLAVLWRVDEDGLYRARWEPSPQPAPRPLPLPDHRQPLHHRLEPVRPGDLAGAHAAARRGAGRQGRGRPRLPAGEGPGGDRRPAAGREREPHPPPAPRRLRPGDLHRRRPAGHREGRARRPLRGQREPRRPDPDPGGQRPRRLRQPHRRRTSPFRPERRLSTRGRNGPLLRGPAPENPAQNRKADETEPRDMSRSRQAPGSRFRRSPRPKE